MIRASRFASIGVSARLLGVAFLIALLFVAGCTTSGNSETQLAVATLAGGLPSGSMAIGGGVYPATTLTASGGTAPFKWTVSSGSLPPGLALNNSGTISGSPTTAGTYPFTVTVTDSATPPHTATANLSITINAQLVISTTGSLTVTGEAGAIYPTTALAETGGVGPFTWVINSGNLPGGLSLSNTGSISGTVSASAVPGVFNFTAKVTDSQGNMAISGPISIKIDAALAIIAPTLPTGVVSANYTSPAFTATGGPGSGYAFAVASGSLPVPLALGASTGIISGAPTAAGTSTFTVKVTDSLGYSATTGSLSITINQAPAITTNPSNQTVTAGGNASFTAAASGTPASSVQWQVSTNNGVTFSNVGGATSATLSLTAVTAAQNGNQYRAVFTNTVGNATTTAATLTVDVAPTITQQPANQTVNAGSSTSFIAAASGNPAPTVQWQVSTDNGATFSNVAGATSTTLSFTATSAQNGSQYRAAFTNSVSTVTSSPATLTVDFAPAITANPTNQTVVAGTSATFTATASGNPAPTVQWQVSTDGGATFSNVGGATATTLSFTPAANQNGNQYRAVFTNSLGNITSSAATLTVNVTPAITTNPSPQTVTAGSTASFTAAASGTPAPTVQWQVSTDNGVTFSNVSGATSATLSFTTTAAQNGNKYRAVFTNTAGSATSSAAALTVNSAPAITQQPSNQTVASGATANFTAAASGNPVPTVQWQVSTDGGATFNNVGGATSNTLSFTAASAQNGNQYRATFTNTLGNVTTSAATLTVTTAPAITTNPSPQTVSVGNTATFSAAASGTPAPTVQWQVSTDNGATFSNLGGATSTTLSFTTTAVQNRNQYRAVFTNTFGNATTSVAILTVNFPPAITQQPGNQTVAAGATANFTAAASGNPVPTVQWQVSTDGGATFSNVGGATSNTLSFTAASIQNGNQYRATFTNTLGNVTTSAATLTVTTAPAITTNPSSQTIVAGNTATFSAAASGTPAPSVQWQVSADNGATFSNVNGATSTTFSFATTPAQNGNQYRAIFTNTSGNATTSAATLTVHSAPAITSANTTTFTVGVNGTFTVKTTGNPTPALSETGTALPGNVTFTDNLDGTATISGKPNTGTAGNYSITISAANGVGTNGTQSFTLVVVASTCNTNCTISGTVTGAWVSNVAVSISGGTPTTTDASGHYSFTGLAGGTYTITPSLTGYTYIPVAPQVSTTSTITTQDFVATSAISSFSISGTLSYSGIKTGTTFIRVFQSGCTGGCNTVAGTSISTAPSSSGTSYTVRGLQSAGSGGGGNYFVRAEIDTLGTGQPNSSNPVGTTSTITINSANVVGANIILNDQTPPAPVTPTQLSISPGNQMAVAMYKVPKDANGAEIATSYTISIGTDVNASIGGTPVTFAAHGPHDNVYIFHGLTNGTYYFKITAHNANGDSAASAVVGPKIVGPASGANTVSGSVTFPGSATGPLYAGVFDNNTGAIYVQTIASPVSPQPYSVSGVPNGTYQNFAIIDMNNDGLIGVGDIDNVNTNNGTPPITVSGNTTGNMTLSGAATTLNVATQHQRFSGDSYQLSLNIDWGTKRPVAVTLFSGPNVPLPFDMGSDKNNSEQTPSFLNGAIPVVGDTYQFQVTFSDGITQIISGTVTAVINSFPQSLTMIITGAGTPTTPVLSWSAPSSPPSLYTYSVDLNGTNNGENWFYSGGQNNNGIPPTQLSVPFNTDGSASISPLPSAGTFRWSVTVQDANGNNAQLITTYTTP